MSTGIEISLVIVGLILAATCPPILIIVGIVLLVSRSSKNSRRKQLHAHARYVAHTAALQRQESERLRALRSL